MDSFDGTRPAADSPPARATSRRRRHRTRRGPKDPWNLRFASIGAHIPAAVVADCPTLLVVAVEDMCWQLAMDSWRAAKPGRRHRRAYTAWQAQYQQLQDKRARLQALVDEALTAG